MSEKLQKVLARAGLGSRREIEQWISAGRISVDGQVATLGDRVEVTQQIRVDGHPVTLNSTEKQICRVLAYHKPEGEVCSRRDPEGRKTVFESLPKTRNGRWVAVGRLDLNTSGLLLFTTDGELANRLMHPSQQVAREYAVRVFGEVSAAVLRNLTKGVMLDDGEARFDSVKAAGGSGANHWYHVTLQEGRNREVRRLWESQGVTVSRLTRVRYADVSLPKRLPTGSWAELPLDEVNQLRERVGLPPEQKSVVTDSATTKRLDPQKLRRVVRRNKGREPGRAPRPPRARRR